MPTIAVLGTMDTKGIEHGFVADLIRQRGHAVIVIDVGTLGESRLKPDITRAEVAAAARVALPRSSTLPRAYCLSPLLEKFAAWARNFFNEPLSWSESISIRFSGSSRSVVSMSSLASFVRCFWIR